MKETIFLASLDDLLNQVCLISMEPLEINHWDGLAWRNNTRPSYGGSIYDSVTTDWIVPYLFDMSLCIVSNWFWVGYGTGSSVKAECGLFVSPKGRSFPNLQSKVYHFLGDRSYLALSIALALFLIEILKKTQVHY